MTQNQKEKTFRPVKNIYIVGNPIKSKEMFFGRDDDFKMIRNNILNQGHKVILLKGGHRSGKTSILYQIANGRIKDAGETVFCDFHQITPQLRRDEDLPFQIGNAILSSERFAGLKDIFFNGNESWTVKLGRLTRACIKKTDSLGLLILCDEYEAIEGCFSHGILSDSSLMWISDMMNLPVYFIMTGSKEWSDNLSPVFSGNSVIQEITLLSEKDTNDLIVTPIKGELEYLEDTVQMIYRLSGGYPFYVQYICQTLVNQINSHFHRNYTVPSDLEKVIDFIIRNPTGHIQETWRSVPDNTKLTLSVMASILGNQKEYVKPSEILNTANNLRFPLGESEYNKAVSYLKDKTQLIERQKNGAVRFHIDIFRHWVKYHFQTLEDMNIQTDPLYKENKISKKKVLLKKGIRYFFLITGLILAVGIGVIIPTEIDKKADYLIPPDPVTPEIPITPESVIKKIKTIGENNQADFFQIWSGDKTDFTIGKEIIYYFQSSKNCYAVLLDVATSGEVIQIFPNAYSTDNFVQENKKYAIPDKNWSDDEWEYLEIAGPAGEEKIIALVSEKRFNLFPEDFTKEMPLLKLGKENHELAKQISENIRGIEKLNIAQKNITYWIKP